MKRMLLFLVMLLCISGCALARIPSEVLRMAGTAVKTTGQIVESTGHAVVATAQAVGKVAEAGGKAAETVATTPGAREAVLKHVIP